MAFPVTNTNLYGPDVPVNIPVPAVGYYNYFFNSNDMNRIWYKNSDSQFFIYGEGMCDPCLCETASKTMCALDQALLDGTMTPAEYATQLATGITFTCVTNGVENTFTIGG